MANPKVDEKRRDEQQQEVVKSGLYAATESDDNAVAVSNEQFFGAEPERKNFAYETDAPLEAEYEDDDDSEKRQFEAARKVEAEKAERAPVGRTGFSPNLTHPTERKSAAAKTAEFQRTVLEAQALEAQRTLDSASSSSDTDTTADTTADTNGGNSDDDQGGVGQL